MMGAILDGEWIAFCTKRYCVLQSRFRGAAQRRRASTRSGDAKAARSSTVRSDGEDAIVGDAPDCSAQSRVAISACRDEASTLACTMLTTRTMSEPTVPERLQIVRRDLRGARATTLRLQKLLLVLTAFPMARVLRIEVVPFEIVFVGSVAWIWMILVLCKSRLYERRLRRAQAELMAELAPATRR